MRKKFKRYLSTLIVLSMILSMPVVLNITAAYGAAPPAAAMKEVTLFVGNSLYSANKAYLKTSSGGGTGSGGVSWSSGNAAIATVDGKGEVTALAVGETIITAISATGDESWKVEVLAMPGISMPNKPAASKPTSNQYPQNDSVHDPEITYVASEGLYYMVCTNTRIIRSSPDLVNWTTRQTLPTSVSATSEAHVRLQGNYNSVGFWAPDIIYNPKMGKYLIYYSSSNSYSTGRGIGNKCSAIGMTYLEPVDGQAYSMGTLNNWKDGGIVVKSYDAWRYPGNNPNYQLNSGYFQFGLNNVLSAEFGPNAIDPMVFFDKSGERMYMVYGSFFEGIHIIELNPMTGLPFDQASLDPQDPDYAVRHNTGVCVVRRGGAYAFAQPLDERSRIPGDSARTQNGIEGSCIFYNDKTGYYYLFVSYDDLASDYNVRVARSRSVTGPYYDYNGFNMVTGAPENLPRLNPGTIFTNDDIDTDPNFRPNPLLGANDGMLKIETLAFDPQVGTKILAPYRFAGGQNWVGIGHNCVFKAADGEWTIGSHAKTPQRLHVRKLLWTDDGWPMASPARYSGEIVSDPIDASRVVGSFELAVMSRLRPAGNASVVTGVAANLNSDWTVTSNNAQYNGTWLMYEGNKIKVTINGVTYKGQVAAGWDWDNWDGVELVFAGLSDDGTMLWGKGGSVSNFTPAYDVIKLATGAYHVKAGDYFTLSTVFKVRQNSNAAILKYTFDGSKFEYAGFTAAPGVQVLNTEYGDGFANLTVASMAYDLENFGVLMLRAKEDAALANEYQTVSLSADFVILLAGGEKAIYTAGSAARFTTLGGGGGGPAVPGDTNGDGILDLIDLSNMIDWFGYTSMSPDWEALYTFFDFNDNGEIDISDLAYVARLIS